MDSLKEQIIACIEEDIWSQSLTILGISCALEDKGIDLSYSDLLAVIKEMKAEGTIVYDGSSYSVFSGNGSQG